MAEVMDMRYTINVNNERAAKEYEGFMCSHPAGSFMQSLKWAEVKSGWGHYAIAVKNKNDEVKGAALILTRKIPVLNTYFMYCPRGPVFSSGDQETLNELLASIKKIAEEIGACILKCDPAVKENDVNAEMLKEAGFRLKKTSEDNLIQSKNNYILPFNGRSKEELFADFHKKWRYNIRVAERHGVKCRVCGKEALDDFCELMKETGDRDGFCERGREYFEQFLDEMGDNAKLYMTYCGGMPLAGAINVTYGRTSSYVYGASTCHMRKVMPNYLMQWTMISAAADNGCEVYDFQGVPHYYDEKHSNYGVYRFKSGFNGEVASYAGEFDMTYSKKALIINAGICIRKLFLKVAAHFSNKENNKEKEEIQEKPLTIHQKVV